MKLWNEAKRANAQKLIDWLLSERTDSGWTADLVSLVAFAELGSSSSHPDLTESVVMQVLNEMSQGNTKSVDDFEEAFKEYLRANAIAENKKLGHWRILIPIDVALSADIARPNQIRILGKRFSFLSLTSVERQLGKKHTKNLLNPTLMTFHTGIKIEHIPRVFLSVYTQAPSRELAWKEIEPAFDALRGLIELSLSFFDWRISNSVKSARRKVPHPLMWIAYKQGVPPEPRYFNTEEDNSTKTFNLNRAALALIKKNAAILRKEPEPQSTLALIADSLRLYSQAMDHRFKHFCFLGFWQLAEAITRAQTVGGNTDKVAARLAWHGSEIGLKGSGYEESLRVFGKKRNDIVHRGIHEIEDDDINILKLACEAALNWLVRVHKSLPTTAHVEHYYRLREMKQTDIEAIRDCVTYINKQKRK